MREYTVSTDDFVWTCTPTQPTRVVLSVPHDAPSWSKDFEQLFARRRECSAPDVHAWIVAAELMQRVPIIVLRQTIHRAFLEVNTERGHAFVDPTLEPLYDAYHQKIEKTLLCADGNILQSALLIDLHGFTNQPTYGEYDCILGTAHRNTLKKGSVADIRLAHFLEGYDMRTFLPGELPLTAQGSDRYNGGATVRMHGGKNKHTAIQIETHKKFRGDDPEPRNRLVTALEEFIQAYNKYEFE